MRRMDGPRVDFSAARGKRVLIALSGGADSTALLLLLRDARDALGIDLVAAHLDHAIRPESAGDAEWCQALCQRFDIPFRAARIDVPAEAARSGEGLEAAARRVRYAWLRSVKEEVGADCVALAHHMDDQAETVLMHLLRGAGSGGAAGMAPLSGDLYRPLLGVRREALRAFLVARGQDWREDHTNALADNPRNVLRLHGIPALEQSYPQATPALARYADIARTEDDFLARETKRFLAERATALPGGHRLALSPMPHPALLRRAIRALTDDEPGHDRVVAAARLAERARGREDLNGRFFAERGRGGLYVLERREASAAQVPLQAEGETVLPGVCALHASPTPACPVRDDPMRQALRKDALAGAVVRTRRPGDRIRPLGTGEKLLSDYLTDRRIDRPVRDCLALVARGSEVLWVCGVGIAEGAKLRGPGDEAVLLACRYPFDMRALVK